MFPVPTNETIAETKACKHCGAAFPITNKDLEFYEKVSPVIAGEKYTIPSPSLCPDCRQQRRLSFRNERKLYKRRCDATGKDIISIYSPDKSYKVYSHDFWWSDDWDSMEYGIDFDFGKSFFEQYNLLIKNVPTMALANAMNENAEYNNYINRTKNAYMSAVVYAWCEDIYYSSWIFSSKNIVDCLSVYDSENCYFSTNIKDCSGSKFLIGSANCTNCLFWKHLVGCSDCIFCTNLTNKRYYVHNKEVSLEDFKIIRDTMINRLATEPQEIFNEFQSFIVSQPAVSMHLIACDNCTGENISNGSNSHWCFDSFNLQNAKWIVGQDSEDVYDGMWWSLKRCYEYCRVGWGTNNVFSYNLVDSNYISYSMEIYQSSNCFWCFWLRGKSYCIFNKQYTKEEYEVLVPKIIEHMKQTGEWGEFFPSSLSPFGYNETVAGEYFPLTKSEALERGFQWSDYETPFPKVEKIIPASKLPGNIAEIPDDILNWAIECEVTKKPFRIISQELEFYRKHNLPIPHRHPDQRHLDRIKLRNPRKLFERKCDCCGVQIMTSYAPERPETVYCEACYNKEVA